MAQRGCGTCRAAGLCLPGQDEKNDPYHDDPYHSEVDAVAFTPDGRTVMTGISRVLKHWNAAGAKLLKSTAARAVFDAFS
jgi:hypothetical protein